MAVEMQASPPTKGSEEARSTNWLLVVIVGLVCAALGFGAGYLAFAQDSDGGTNDAVEALLDDFYEAMNAEDVDALQAMSMEDAVILGVPVASGSLLSGSLESRMDRTGGVAPVDDPIVEEHGWIFHAAQLTALSPDNPDEDVIWLFNIVDSDSPRLGGDGTEQELKIVYVEEFVD